MTKKIHRFIIIEKDSFIARDMAEGLQATYPECTVAHYSHLPDAMADPVCMMSDARNVFISKLAVDQIDETGLAGLAQQTGADIVVRLGVDPESRVTGRGWFTLPVPFTWDDLGTLVKRLHRGNPVS